jgi:hypothetical protein
MRIGKSYSLACFDSYILSSLVKGFFIDGSCVPLRGAPGHSPTFPKQQAQGIPYQYYPEGSEQSNHLRSLLVFYLDSPRYAQRLPEPQGVLDFSIYRYESNRFICSVHGCGASSDRWSRMRDHFRVHIDHRPYPCSGCRISNWYASVSMSHTTTLTRA